MDQIHHIRALFFEQGQNISDIARSTGYNWKTVAKYIDKDDFNEATPKPASEQRFCPKLEPFKPTIDGWLEEDKKRPRKQRHTAKRVYKRLVKECPGFDCSYRLVAAYVSQKKEELRLKRTEGFLPLQHAFGEAQGDFGSAEFYENGYLISGKHLVLSFPNSNAGFIQLNYGENMECLLEGLTAIFKHIGGVPPEIWFDNTATIVTEVIKGGGRLLTDKFTRFMDHYGFKAVFMNPAEGHEKGNVENKVGYSRKNLLVPAPKFSSLKQFNEQLLKDCDEDLNREHYYKPGTIAELFKADQKHLLPLPAIEFDTSTLLTGIRTNGYGRFTLNNGKHEYSVSPSHALSSVNVRLTSAFVTVLDENYREIVRHRRLYGNEAQSSMEWVPYLDYISRHPRSLRNTGIYDMMPDSMRVYLDSCEGSDRKDVLQVLSELTNRTGFESAVQTVNQAILYQANDPDSLRSLYSSIHSDVPELPPLTGSDTVPKVTQIPVNLSDYDALLQRKRGANHG